MIAEICKSTPIRPDFKTQAQRRRVIHTHAHTHIMGRRFTKVITEFPQRNQFFICVAATPPPEHVRCVGSKPVGLSLQANCYRAVVVRKSFSSKPHYWSDRIKHSAPTVYVCVCVWFAKSGRCRTKLKLIRNEFGKEIMAFGFNRIG